MKVRATIDDGAHDVIVELDPEGAHRIVVDGHEMIVDCRELGPGVYSLLLDQRSFEARVTEEGDVGRGESRLTVSLFDDEYVVELRDPRRVTMEAPGGVTGRGARKVAAPMHGKVVRVLVADGQAVEPGQGLVVIEAMKMENEIKATVAGVVHGLGVKVGDSVEQRASLCTIEPAEA